MRRRAIVVFALAGCRSAAVEPGEDGSSTTTLADSGSESSTGADACAPLEPEQGGSSVVITLRNGQGVPIFVGYDGGCVALPLRMVDLAAAPEAEFVNWLAGDCANTCSQVLANECSYCGPCLGSVLIRIDPGATFDVQWDGALHPSLDVPLDCLAEPCEPSCETRLVAPDGEYGLMSVARTICPGSEQECSCADGATACEVVVAGPLDEGDLEAASSLTVPGAGVEIVY